MEEGGGRAAVFAPLERQRFLAEALRLLRLEEGTLDRYAAVRIVKRTASFDAPLGLTIDDRVLVRIPLDELERMCDARSA